MAMAMAREEAPAAQSCTLREIPARVSSGYKMNPTRVSPRYQGKQGDCKLHLPGCFDSEACQAMMALLLLSYKGHQTQPRDRTQDTD